MAENDRAELLRLASQEYPYPVAQAARRLQAANTPGERFDEAFQLGRTLIVTLGTVALSLCAYEALQPGGVHTWYRQFITQTVSLGVWLGAARDGARAAHRNGKPLAGMAKALGSDASALRRDLEALVDLRNQFLGDKSAVRGDAAKREVLTAYEPRLLGALRGADFLRRMSFVWIVSSELQRDSATFRTRARRMRGSDPVFMLDTFDSPVPLLTRTPYLLQQDAAELELTPFLTVADCRACGGPELYYLNRRQGRRFLFTSFVNTHTHEADKLQRDLPWSDNGSPIAGFRTVPSPGLLTGPVRLDGARAGTQRRIDLPTLYGRTQASLLAALREDQSNGWRGWNHHLSLQNVTFWATALGLRIMKLTSDEVSPFDPTPMLDTLWAAKQLDNGGWSTTQQFPLPRPEATAEVLLALHAYADPRARTAIEVFEDILRPGHDEGLWQHVYSLAMAMEALATIRPDAPVLPRLVAVVDDAARRDERLGTLCWTEYTRLDPRSATAQPSVALTARTALALMRCYFMTDGALGRPPTELQPVATWLLTRKAWESETTEVVRRPSTVYRDEVLTTRHFTSAMAVRALLRLGCDPGDPRIAEAVAKLYAQHDDGLWNWEGDSSIDRPMWATWEALQALRDYAHRATVVPRVQAEQPRAS